MSDPHSPRPGSRSVTREALQRLREAIEGERRDWHTVEVRPDDIAATLAAIDAIVDQAITDAIFDALPAADPASSAEADAAWRARPDDRADDGLWLVETDEAVPEDVALYVTEADARFMVDARRVAIRSAGTPPAEVEQERESVYSHGYGDGLRAARSIRAVGGREALLAAIEQLPTRWVEFYDGNPSVPVVSRAAAIEVISGGGPVQAGATGATTQDPSPDGVAPSAAASPPTGVSETLDAGDDQCPERCLGVVGHAGPHQTSDYEPDTLGAAWAEAEAELPEGWSGPVLRRSYDFPGQYWALMSEDAGDHFREGYGSTPAAALHALTVALAREQADSEPLE